MITIRQSMMMMNLLSIPKTKKKKIKISINDGRNAYCIIYSHSDTGITDGQFMNISWGKIFGVRPNIFL